MAFRKRREALRSILTGPACIRPGSVYDAISIRIAEDLGFELGMFGGSVASLAVLGDPDIALITLTELAEQSLKTKSFHGAYEEFREARQDLLAGDTKGCISNAQKAFESALKTLLGTDRGNASNLIRQFVADGHVNDLPTEFKASFGEQVLMSVPTMGNRLGRHGQGAAVINVPAAYAQLTLEMAAAYLNFLVKLRPPDPQPAVESTEISDDAIPF